MSGRQQQQEEEQEEEDICMMVIVGSAAMLSSLGKIIQGNQGNEARKKKRLQAR